MEEDHHLSQNEDELRSMFDEWAQRYNKVYSSEKEREDLFSTFLFEMHGANNTDGLDESVYRMMSELVVSLDKDMDKMWWEFSPDSPGYEPECCSFSPCALNNDEPCAEDTAQENEASPVAQKHFPSYGWINEDEEHDPDDIIILTHAGQIA